MKTIATFLAGLALGAALLGLVHTASASTSDDNLARDQVAALREIASEIRTLGRECEKR